MTRKFHLGDILAVFTGMLLSPNGLQGQVDLVTFLLGGNSYYGSDLRRCALSLGEQLPWLNSQEFTATVLILMDGIDATTRRSEERQALIAGWLVLQVQKYGDEHEVHPIG